jgi:hypothetical protein
VAGAAALLGAVAPAAAFDLPDAGTLLGIADPFAVFPDSLPATVSLRTRVEARELYRHERGAEFQDYDLWNTQALALVRSGNAWVGVRHGTAGVAFDQREVYGERDELRGRRRVEHVAAAIAVRPGWCEVRALLGGSQGLDAGVHLRGLAVPGGSLSAWAWWWQGGTDVSQKIHETTFHFPFRYHERAAGAEWTRARGPRQWRARAAYRGLAGEEPYEGQYNRLDAHRLRLEAVAAPAAAAGAGWDATLSADGATAGCEMALDGTVYARVRDVRTLRFGGEAGWRARPSVRISAGYDRYRIRCDDPGFADAWPFTVWDVFLATRYRLESIDAHLGVAHAGASWSRGAGRFSWELRGRWEWWASDGDLFWKERVATLPPFFFRFDHHRDGASLSPTHGMQADASVRCDVGRGFARLDAQSVAPWGRRDDGNGGGDGGTPDPTPNAGEPESVRGGLRVVVVLGADW